MKAIQYRPTFYSGFTNKEVEFDTVEELLNIDFVKSWSEDKGFCRYSLSGDHLMAEFNNGKNWWVVCFIRCTLDLPQFKAQKTRTKKKRLDEKKNNKNTTKVS